MMRFTRFKLRAMVICSAAVAALAALVLTLPAPQAAIAATAVGEPYIGNPGKYDYSPTMIQTGGIQDWWWCGQTDTDTILHQSHSPTTGMSAISTAFSRGAPGAWDSAFVCNPAAIQGSFTNPFGDGLAYSYAIYYVATDRGDGRGNSIGVAFSQDKQTWRKYPTPVIVPHNIGHGSYGVGEPAVVNLDGAQHLRVFYNDSTLPGGAKQVAAETTDGVTFTPVGTVTTRGIYAATSVGNYADVNIGNSDFVIDASTGMWYLAMPSGPLRPLAPGSKAGDYREREYGQFTLYRISSADLFSPSGEWEVLTHIGTAQTGHVVNAIPGFARDGYGRVNTISQWPSIQMFFNVSNPRPTADATALEAQRSAATSRWDISWAAWNGSEPFIPLTRSWSSTSGTHLVTTGYRDVGYFDVVEGVIGDLREAPDSVATVPLFSCKVGAVDYFLSKDKNCEGQFYVGLIGYAASSAANGSGLIPLYRCYNGVSHFASSSSSCEGQTVEHLLGYIFP